MNFWFIKYCDFQKKSRSVLLPGALAVHRCRVLIAVEEMFPGRGRQLKLKVINHILILLLKTTNKTGRVLSCSEPEPPSGFCSAHSLHAAGPGGQHAVL